MESYFKKKEPEIKDDTTDVNDNITDQGIQHSENSREKKNFDERNQN